MPKLAILYLLLLQIIGTLVIFPNSVFALETCQNPIVQTIPTGETSPRELKTSDVGAEFTVDVNRKKEESGVKSWILEWECGSSNRRVAEPVGDNNIKTNLTNAGGNCAFKTHSGHAIKVKQLTDRGEVEFCQATYPVLDADKYCRLTLTSDHRDATGTLDNKIITTSKLELSGSDLTPDGQFNVFIDKTPIGVNRANLGLACQLQLGACVKGPIFSGYEIPQEYMIQGSHTISLRLRNSKSANLPFGEFHEFYGQSLCSITYTVGTESNPGSVIGSSSGGSGASSIDCKSDPAKCSSSGGETCSEGIATGGVGIKTAIGCVPTEPRALVNGILRVTAGGIGAVALLLMIMGAITMITADGNPDTIQRGKDQFTAAFLGLLFIIFSVLLLQVIGVDILGLPGFGKV